VWDWLVDRGAGGLAATVTAIDAAPEVVEIARDRVQQYIQHSREQREQRIAGSMREDGDETQPAELTWQERLLDTLMSMPPGGFERLAQRLLREAGFTSAQVTGRSGGGGIDGLGVYRMSLVSFPVFFQCKRYSGSARIHR
jgi:restriction system protein